MDTRARSASEIARDAAKRKSLCGWRKHGTSKHAAAACGKARRTVEEWYRHDPEYRGQVNAAIDEYAATAGQETHNALLEHVRSAARGDYVVTKRGTGENGKPINLEERVALNPALVRLLLTRADPRFTHPKQEVEHSGQVAVQAALDEIGAALAAHDAEPAPDATPEPDAPQDGAQALSGGISAAELDEALGE